MKGLNKVTLIGYVGKDPEIKHLDGGLTVAKFSLATTEKYKNKAGEMVEQTEWHNLVAFGKLSEVIEKYIKKGSAIYLEGKIKTRSYEPQGGGDKRYFTEIVVDSINMLDQKKTTEKTYSPEVEQAYAQQYQQQPDGKDDLPF